MNPRDRVTIMLLTLALLAGIMAVVYADALGDQFGVDQSPPSFTMP